MNKIKRMGKIECFKIMIIEGDSKKPWNLDLSKSILIIPCAGLALPNHFNVIEADPFLFVYKGFLYLFYEDKLFNQDGVLKMIRTKDLKVWSKPVTVLQEPFHLSYPCVFEDEGVVYMIPETSAAKEVRLYKADDEDLEHFSQDCVLLKHELLDPCITIDYSDSSVFKYEGKYFLMTTLCINRENQLHLYVSNDLKGPYTKHPMSPVCTGQKFGRNAGCLFCVNGKVFRVAQDCTNRYGDNVHLFEVIDISDSSYDEKLVKEYLYDTSCPFYKEGGHHFNVAQFAGKTIVATDAKEYNYYIANRIIKKISTIL